MITVTAKDALKSEQVQPGLYKGKCVGHSTKPSKGDGSTNHLFEIEIEDKSGRYVPIQDYLISEKAISMGKGFFLACGFPKEEWQKLIDGQATSYQIDPASCIGKEFRVQVVNDKFDNRILNKAGDFFPLV